MICLNKELDINGLINGPLKESNIIFKFKISSFVNQVAALKYLFFFVPFKMRKSH